MALVENTLYGRIDKVQIALERIRDLDPTANGFMDEPYYVAYSGGKDSDAIRILFELSGSKYDLVHNLTTADAPETVRYVRSIPGIQISHPEISMWNLIAKKRMPPTRLIRYCCKHLKERGGMGRFVVTGVRWAESARRKNNRGSLEILRARTAESIMLNADNTENRRVFESCTLKGKRILNPIVDWTDDDVWEFLQYYGCQSNPLYQCGYKRVGCIGCPMVREKKRLQDFERYPKYKDNYIRAFERMLKQGRDDGIEYNWETGQEVYNWWIADPERKKGEDENQLSLFSESYYLAEPSRPPGMFPEPAGPVQGEAE